MTDSTTTRDAALGAQARGRLLAEIADPLRLTCAEMAHHDDVIRRAGIRADAFRFHDPADLPEDEQCFCAEPVVVGNWDEENRLERNRRCHAPAKVSGPGYTVTACCACFDRAGADEAKLAEAARLVARTIRKVEAARKPLERVADRTVAELQASRLLLRAGYTPEQLSRARRALHGEA